MPSIPGSHYAVVQELLNAMGLDVDELAQLIRKVDGKHTLGAGALAEHIAEWLAIRVQAYYLPNLVRYCYECGHVGSVPAGAVSCCPDGSAAQHIHVQAALQAHAGFLTLIGQGQQSAAEEAKQRELVREQFIGWKARTLAEDDRDYAVFEAGFFAAQDVSAAGMRATRALAQHEADCVEACKEEVAHLGAELAQQRAVIAAKDAELAQVSTNRPQPDGLVAPLREAERLVGLSFARLSRLSPGGPQAWVGAWGEYQDMGRLMCKLRELADRVERRSAPVRRRSHKNSTTRSA